MPSPRAADLVRPEILQAKAYQVADATGLIKLDAMEAPRGLPASLKAEWQQWVGEADWHRYPDGNATGVKQALRSHFGMDEGLGLLLGNGSDEIIQMLTMALARPGASLLTPEPGFTIYRSAARAAGMGYQALALNPQDFSLDLSAALETIEQSRPALIFIANPNNPTGNLFPREQMLAIAEAAPGLVIVDEAYFPHSESHCLDLAGQPSNLAVMRTLSKAGMAGLRLGWLLASPEWTDALERIRMPYNINAFTQMAARFALQNHRWWQDLAAELRQRREVLFGQLAEMEGVEVWPSQANFLLVRLPQASRVHQQLRDGGVLVKNLDGQHPALRDCLRLTVGTEDETERLLLLLKQALT